MEEHKQDAAPTTEGQARRPKRMRNLLAGSLVGLLVLGGAYYFYSQRAEDRSVSGPEHTGAQAPASQAPAARQGREAGAVVEQAAGPPPATPGQPRASSEPSGSPDARPPAATAAKGPDAIQPAQAVSPQPARNEPPQPAQNVAPQPAQNVAPQPAQNVAPQPAQNVAPQPAQSESPRQPGPIQAAPAAGTGPARSLQDQSASLPGAEVLFVQKSRANLRSQPRSRSKIVGSAPKGQRVEVIRRNGSWVQVRADVGEGWMNRRLLGAQTP
jgi:outer membrane biosynthesis protein TonB